MGVVIDGHNLSSRKSTEGIPQEMLECENGYVYITSMTLKYSHERIVYNVLR